MRKNILLYSLLLAGFMFSCESQMDEPVSMSKTDYVKEEVSKDENMFPTEDDAVILLDSSYCKQMLYLLEKVDPQDCLVLYDTKIKDDEFQEIKLFTDNLVKGLTNKVEIMDKIFFWVADNIGYVWQGYVDNDPYPVFKNRKAICQGYANLYKVMLLTQNIPVISINGLANINEHMSGHAWNYSYANGDWFIADPTNGRIHMAVNDFEYDSDYQPLSAELALFENDNYLFEFSNGHLNIASVKQGSEKLTLPYSAGGFVVTSFNPEKEMPAEVKEVYIGKNIASIGVDGSIGLKQYGKSVEMVYIDPENSELESINGVVYLKKGDTVTPYFIPNGMTRIEFKPNKVYGKGLVYGHENLEEMYFPDGVEKIEDYAVEACPKLKYVSIPEKTEVSENAFYGMSQNIEIHRRSEGTGIPVVTVD